jgi:hypothetical protein
VIENESNFREPKLQPHWSPSSCTKNHPRDDKATEFHLRLQQHPRKTIDSTNNAGIKNQLTKPTKALNDKLDLKKLTMFCKKQQETLRNIRNDMKSY